MTTQTAEQTFDWATKDESASGHRHVIGEKCEACGEVSMWQPFGGAQTFADVDRYTAATELQQAVEGQMAVFDAILYNIRSAADLAADEKATRIEALAAELGQRLSAARTAEEQEQATEGREGLNDAQEEALGVAALRTEAAAVTEDGGSMLVFREKGSGDLRWIAIHTNKFKDREEDIFPEHAHKAFVDEANRLKEFPTLRLWHVPYPVGQADFLDYDSNGFVVSSGKFYAGMEDVGENLKKEKELGCSHGYIYRRSDYRNGVYNSYKTFEVSALPRARAANTLTAFFAGEEIPSMTLTPDRKEFLERVAGPERVALMEQTLATVAEKAVSSGISYKDMEAAVLAGVAASLEEAAGQKDEPAAAPAAAPAATPVATPPVAVTPPAAAAPAATAPAATPEVPVVPEVPTPTAEEQAAAAAALARGDADEEENALVKALTSAVSSVVTPLSERIDTLTQQVEGLKVHTQTQDELLESLKSGSDFHLADLIRPRIGPTAAVATSRKDDAGGELSEEERVALESMKALPGPTTPIDGYLADAARVPMGA